MKILTNLILLIALLVAICASMPIENENLQKRKCYCVGFLMGKCEIWGGGAKCRKISTH